MLEVVENLNSLQPRTQKNQTHMSLHQVQHLSSKREKQQEFRLMTKDSNNHLRILENKIIKKDQELLDQLHLQML